jgi:hypothetical protein
MAESENEVVLTQKGAVFGGDTAKVLNHFLSGLQTFGYNFSVICDTLIQFFQATKLFLESFRNPLVAGLIETIDSLIEALEELQSLGFGNINVWPWVHGTYPQQVNTEKLDEAMLGLIAAMEGIDIGDIRFSERGRFVQTKNGESLLTPQSQFKSASAKNVFQTKDTIYDCLTGIRNFFHPELWAGTTTPFWLDSPYDAAQRRLRDEEAGRMGSFEALSSRREESGDYEQSLMGQAADWSKDTLLDTIDYTQKNLFVRELTPEQAINKIVQSLSAGAPDDNKPTGSGPYKAFMLMFALPTINDVLQVIQQFADYFGSVLGDPLVKKLVAPGTGTNDNKPMTITLGEPLHKEGDWDREDEQSMFYYEESDYKPRKLKDGTYKWGGKIPMFKPGDRIIQTGGVLGFHSFSAEVIKHYPIVVKNGMILQNKVKVKGARGEFLKSNHKPLNSATVPIVRSILTGKPKPNFDPIFRTDTLEKPIERVDGSFFGTIKDGSTTISEIIPNDTTGQFLRTYCQEIRGFEGVDGALKGSKNHEIEISYMDFIRKIKKGMTIQHPFLEPMDLSDRAFDFYNDSAFTGSEFSFNYGKLLDAMPSLEVQYRIANIKIDGVVIENTDNLTTTDLFYYTKSEDGWPNSIGIKKLEFEIGFLNYDGSYDTDFLNIDIGGLINVPNSEGGGVKSWQTTIPTSSDRIGPPNPPFEILSANKNISPNWKYLRISDLFPAYGQVIKEAIGQVKKFKKIVENVAKTLDEYIKFLERQIKAIQRLNDQIQQLIAFFSKGLNGAGIYTGQFGGEGVADFRKKLQSLKMLQTSPNSLNEITLDTIETDTEIEDPFTGLKKTVKRKVLRPKTIKAEDREELDGIPKELSELDNLKYSGAIVFFAQGPDISKFDTFMNNFNGLATLGKGFLSNLYDTEHDITKRLSLRVHDIQGQKKDETFANIEQLGSIDEESTIRIVFTNETDGLSKTDRDLLNSQMERTIDFSPKVQMSSVVLTNSEDNSAHTKNDSIILFQGTYDQEESTADKFSEDSVFHQFVTQPRTSMIGSSLPDEDGNYEKQYFNIDLKPKKPLKRSNDKYKIIVQTSIINPEGIALRERAILEIGFSINPVTVSSGELV